MEYIILGKGIEQIDTAAFGNMGTGFKLFYRGSEAEWNEVKKAAGFLATSISILKRSRREKGDIGITQTENPKFGEPDAGTIRERAPSTGAERADEAADCRENERGAPFGRRRRGKTKGRESDSEIYT